MSLTQEARDKMGWRKDRTFTAIYKRCVICDIEFRTVPSSSKQYCCSRKCMAKRKEKIKKKFFCKICGLEFLSRASRNRVYCSTQCKIKGLAILRLERYKERRIFNKWPDHKGLKRYLIDKYRKCQLCEWDKEKYILEAHHKDRNSKNNKEYNLQLLCPNCHSLEHFIQKDGQYKNNLGISQPIIKCAMVRQLGSLGLVR